MEISPDLDDDGLLDIDWKKVPGVVRGKHYANAQAGMKFIVRLAPDVARAFPTDESVNTALRMLIDIANRNVPPPTA